MLAGVRRAMWQGRVERTLVPTLGRRGLFSRVASVGICGTDLGLFIDNDFKRPSQFGGRELMNRGGGHAPAEDGHVK